MGMVEVQVDNKMYKVSSYELQGSRTIERSMNYGSTTTKPIVFPFGEDMYG